MAWNGMEKRRRRRINKIRLRGQTLLWRLVFSIRLEKTKISSSFFPKKKKKGENKCMRIENMNEGKRKRERKETTEKPPIFFCVK
jgi:hypothetical protein